LSQMLAPSTGSGLEEVLREWWPGKRDAFKPTPPPHSFVTTLGPMVPASGPGRFGKHWG